MGKHPGFGDFVQAGLSKDVHDALMRWLDKTLSRVQEDAGSDWKGWWAEAQSLRFWIGRDVLGVPLAGILQPSRDKVGRVYPLILAAENVHLAVPGDGGATDQTPWEALETHVPRMQPGQGAASLLDGLTLELPAETEAERSLGHCLWAHHPEGDLEALLRAAGRADLSRAALRRSYWWAPGDANRLPVWLGCHGLPDAGALGWLLAGQPRIEPATVAED
ncbi:type VI secretion system-associated protein TagF [Sagittula sp. M10.9X]|uniref:Type VI secretion system-associated protein TagF n=2 Tax=Sagittula salina TaxID=2820268 RepID=A0A940MNY9_9RHOB|nr:type VI secretion system-associated protein TagF [Sagittula salina]MBP0484976.1 type VI secretion system-associated protein TagF [Sagittula salina]